MINWDLKGALIIVVTIVFVAGFVSGFLLAAILF